MSHNPGFWPEYFESQPALNRKVARAYRLLASERRQRAGELALARLAKSPLFSPGLRGTRA